MLFDSLRREAATFGPALAKAAYAGGLAVTAPDGSTRPIPVTATPVVLSSREFDARAQLSAALTEATLKMARAVLRGADKELLLGALSPLERALAERYGTTTETLATTRVDYFIGQGPTDSGSGGHPWALELNATIPAMQGYSDIAAQAFLEHVGRHFGLSPFERESLVSRNGSNADALHTALVGGYQKARGRPPERVALLSRPHDAQLTEQRHLAERFSSMGTEARVVHPAQLARDAQGRWSADGWTFDFLYRHLFVRRLEEPKLAEGPGAALVKELLSTLPREDIVVLNPPASQLEVKTCFALLSRAVTEEPLARAAGLSEGERDLIARHIPWTRLLREGPGTAPDGDSVVDLVAFVAAHPDRFVLKRAWDYGGRAVFVGHSRHDSSFDERVRAAYGQPLDWAALCARCAQDTVGGGFVVQELVSTRPEPHVLCTEQGVRDVELYVDFSAYASAGLEPQPRWGGVCRGSLSHIVNIVGGGGVVPLLTEEVAASLEQAIRRRTPGPSGPGGRLST